MTRLSPTAREKLWDRESQGRDHCVCNLCGLPVRKGDAWDESHEGAPAALGGRRTGVAHRRCNREHGARIVTPMVAKAKRTRQKHIGAWRSARPLPGGRGSRVSKKMDGSVVRRMTQGEKLRETLERRRVGT